MQSKILIFVIALGIIAFSGCISTKPMNSYQLHTGLITLDLPNGYNATLNENSQIITIANDITPNKRAYISLIDSKNKIKWSDMTGQKVDYFWLNTSGRSANDVISYGKIYLASGELDIAYGQLRSTSGDYWHVIKPHIYNGVLDKYIQMTNSTLDVEIGNTMMLYATITD